jgi:hypothetical protein
VIRYALHDLTLGVEHVESCAEEELDRVLHGLSWRRAGESETPPALTLSIRANGAGHSIPASAREVLRAGDYLGFEDDDDFYLTDGATLLRVRSREGRGEVRVAESFSARGADSRHDFWVFSLVKLLQGVGVYSLHAAGLVAPDGAGVLLVGDSGSGKSTLTIGLVRLGWRYLSDDAVLLRSRGSEVEALTFRRSFYIEGSAAERYRELELGREIPDAKGGWRRRVGVEEAYPSQRVPVCTPRLLLFPRIVPRFASALGAVDSATAMGRLLAQSSSQTFDRVGTPNHLLLLKQLLRQTRFYDLEEGTDLHEKPALLGELLAAAPLTTGTVS